MVIPYIIIYINEHISHISHISHIQFVLHCRQLSLDYAQNRLAMHTQWMQRLLQNYHSDIVTSAIKIFRFASAPLIG